MSIKNRIKKLENTRNSHGGDLCVCPDALSLTATPFQHICYKCRKEIDLFEWKDWRLFFPIDDETNFFAGGLKRDDDGELKDKPNDYFIAEVMTLKQRCEKGEFQG